MKKNEICVYTCITGNYDDLKEIENIEQGIDYYCFTNNKNISSNTWNVIYIEDKNLSNVKLARKIKILGHPLINKKYDIQLWMDGAVVFKKNIIDFIKEYLTDEDNFVAFKHGERNSIKDETVACIKFQKETRENVDKILSFYKAENYMCDNGLIESTVYIKRHKNKKVQETMKLWFHMIENYSKRDQLSFNYCIYKTGLNVKWINKKVFDNEWFGWKNHIYEQKIKSYRVYFGDEKDYKIENDIQGIYKINNDLFSFKVKIPENTNNTVIILTNIPCVEFSNLKIKGLSKKDYKIFNYINSDNKNIFYNDSSILQINKTLFKDNCLELSINMKVMDNKEKIKLIESLSIENIILKDNNQALKESIKSKQEYINDLYKNINSSLICRLILKLKTKQKYKD